MRDFLARHAEALAVLAVFAVGIYTFLQSEEPLWALPFVAYAGYLVGEIRAKEHTRKQLGLILGGLDDLLAESRGRVES